MSQTVTLSNTQFDRLNKNAASAGISATTLVGQMLDDEFGGLELGAASNSSVQNIQKQVRSLETLLKQQ